MGKQIICVSSASILAGKGQNNLKIPEWMQENVSENEINVAREQAYSALGQVKLCSEYSHSLSHFSTEQGPIRVAQNLLTYEDFKKPDHRKNFMNQLEILLHNDIVPVINENDATVTKEITVGDNDQLSALVGIYSNSDAVIKASSEKGIMNYSGRDIGQAGKYYEIGSLVEVIDDIERLERDGAITANKSYGGRGGAGSTAKSAEMLKNHGVNYFVIDGREERCFTKCLRGEMQGSVFLNYEPSK